MSKPGGVQTGLSGRYPAIRAQVEEPGGIVLTQRRDQLQADTDDRLLHVADRTLCFDNTKASVRNSSGG